MTTTLTLVKRNLTVYTRDRSGVFLSLLSALILFVLYAFFLGNLQLASLADKFPAVDRGAARHFVDAWVFSGVAMITTLTTSLGAASVLLNDRTSGRFKDFLIAPVRRAQLTSGYMLSCLIVAFSASVMILGIAEAYIAATGGPVPGIGAVGGFMVYLLLLSAAFSALSTFLVSWVRSFAGFSSLSVIVGTLVGFLAGAYLPLGALPRGVVNVLNVMPFSNAAMLLRTTLTAKSVAAMTHGDAAAAGYVNSFYGNRINVSGHAMGVPVSIGVMAGTCLVFLALATLRIRASMR